MNKFLTIIFFLIFSSSVKSENFKNSKPKKSISVIEKLNLNENFEKSFTGKIGIKLDVVFHLVNKNGVLTGYYFYEKTGLEIKLKGTIENNRINMSEFDFYNNKSALIEGEIVSNKIIGSWKNLKTQNEQTFELKETQLNIPKIPKNFVGQYHESIVTDCDFKLTISKKFNEYFYNFEIENKKLKGKITFNRSLEEQKIYVNFEGIKWAEYEGELDDNLEPMNKNLELPIGIQGLFQEEEIFIQNYGNSMNYYTKFSGCGEKYIILQKLERPNNKTSIFYNFDN